MRARDDFRCQLNGKDHLKCAGQLQAAHIVTRGVHGIKYILDNGKTLCQAHHVYYTWRPQFWDALVQNLWPDLWQKFAVERKWQHLEYNLSRDEKFGELLALARLRVCDFSEYLPKLRQIEEWDKKRKTLKDVKLKK